MQCVLYPSCWGNRARFLFTHWKRKREKLGYLACLQCVSVSFYEAPLVYSGGKLALGGYSVQYGCAILGDNAMQRCDEKDYVRKVKGSKKTESGEKRMALPPMCVSIMPSPGRSVG
jgi:hypothetical protein